MKIVRRALVKGFTLVLTLCVSFLVSCKKGESSATGSTTGQSQTLKPLSRLEWNRQMAAGAYMKSGKRSSEWDGAALAALESFAVYCADGGKDASRRDVIAAEAERAVWAGCEDPLVRYLAQRYSTNKALSAARHATRLVSAASALEKSSYPAVQKLRATVDAIAALSKADESAEPLGKPKPLKNPVTYVSDVLEDPAIPVEEAGSVCLAVLELFKNESSEQRFREVYAKLEQPMMRRWPADYRPWLIKGVAHTTLAWISRGGGWANTVTQEGWAGFRSNLAIAREALETGWKLNASNTEIPIQMLTVALGYESRGRDLVELWFSRAMQADPNSVAACRSKLYYLEPRWFGNDLLQLAFGRECVESTRWGGKVPLTMVRVHDTIAARKKEDGRTDHWDDPRVWLDIQEAYDKYLAQNPGDMDERHAYATYAIVCKRWDAFVEIASKLDPVNHEFFGGQEQFNAIWKQAQLLAPRMQPVKLNLVIDSQRQYARLVNRLNFWFKTREQMDAAFEEYEAVLLKYPNASRSERALVWLNEAKLCASHRFAYYRAQEVCARIKKEYRGTAVERAAQQILTDLAPKMKDAVRIPSAAEVRASSTDPLEFK